MIHPEATTSEQEGEQDGISHGLSHTEFSEFVSGLSQVKMQQLFLYLQEIALI